MKRKLGNKTTGAEARIIATAIQNMPKLVLDQGAADGEILIFKSSDVDHGCTDYAETNIYSNHKKHSATAGGARWEGFTEDEIANIVVGRYTNADTGKTTSANAAIQILAQQISGTGITNMDADANVFAILARRGGANATVCIADEDGDWYTDGSNTATYDEHDDALMCQDLAQIMAGEYDNLITHNRDAFETAGIIGPADEHGRFMVSTKRIRMLLLGAIGQLYKRLQIAERKLALLEG